MDTLNTDDVLDSIFTIKYAQYFGVPAALIYVVLAKWVGPRWMESRKAYSLRRLIRIYNIIQIAVNVYILYLAANAPMWKQYLLYHCNPPALHLIPVYMELAEAALVYYWVKYLDLVDTLFIVLKKKNNQLSFLHLFHHTAVVAVASISVTQKDHLGFPIFILNTFVHTVMYTYYFLSSFPKFKKVLWWKPYITRLQITQFMLILVYLLYTWIYQCKMGSAMFTCWVVLVFILLILFLKFYIESYITKKNKNN